MLIKSDPDTIKNYFEDSSNLKGGHAEKLVIPEDQKELADFLKDANSKKIPVTISGGGTGTTGSRIPFGGAIVSTERLNRIREISPDRMSAIVEPGVMVEELKKAVEARGLFYTSHPTEKTAFVGGTVATNASGSRSFRYGPTRKYIKRLKMVLATGEMLDISRGQIFLRRGDSAITTSEGREIVIPLPAYKMPDVKNAAGYFAKDGMDPIDLFIGQEGTLSVITEIEMGLVKRPVNILSSFVFFGSEEDAWGFSEEVKKSPAMNILSIEYFDHNSIELLKIKNPNVPGGMQAAIFFEQETNGKDDGLAVDAWSRIIPKYGSTLENTWVAMNEKDAGKFTDLRYSIPESINEIIKQSGFRKFSTDIAVPGGRFLEMLRFYVDTLRSSGLRHVIFGHIGENHLHVNCLPGSESESEKAGELTLSFVRKGVSLGGTVSAEHGIGKLKHRYLEEMYGKNAIMDMVHIKRAFDPNRILGLDNIFPKSYLNFKSLIV